MQCASTCLAFAAGICCASAAFGQSLFDGSLLAFHASQTAGLPPYASSSAYSNDDFKSEFAPAAVIRRANGALIAAQPSPAAFHQEAVFKTTSLESDAYPAEKCFQLATEIHVRGRSIVWSGSKEVAELKRDQIRSAGPDFHARTKVAFPLGVVIEPLPG